MNIVTIHATKSLYRRWRYFKTKSFLFILLIIFTSIVFSQTNQKAYPELELKLSEVSGHLKFLAADELMGRMTGKPGNEVAARYIAEQFRANGLSTLPGAEDYLQKVPLAKTTPSKLNQVVIQGDTLRQGQNMIVRHVKIAELNAPIVFVDFGMVDAEKGHDDYKGKNVREKIVIAKFGAAENSGMRAGFGAGQEKRLIAAEHGALALIELYDSPMSWQRLVSYTSGPNYEIAKNKEEKADDEIPHILINDVEHKYLSVISSNDNKLSTSLSIHAPDKEFLNSPNVVGMIEGADPTLRQEYILLTAHFDHVGAGMRPGVTPADTIFNGARDNGMGTVALISSSKALIEIRPARSVVFIAFTGEEIGLLGSSYYADHPLVPLNRTVFVQNADGGGYTDTGIVTVLGLERSTAQSAIEEGCKVIGLEAIQDPVPEYNLFSASDNIHFARRGVPSITFSPGFRAFDENIRRFYHQPSDEADENFDFEYLLRYCQAFTHSARLIANMTEKPHWRTGDEFESLSNKLYNE